MKSKKHLVKVRKESNITQGDPETPMDPKIGMLHLTKGLDKAYPITLDINTHNTYGVPTKSIRSIRPILTE